MKKIILSLIIVNSITFQSCKNDKKITENKPITKSISNLVNEENIESSIDDADKILNQDIPKFSDVTIQKFLEEYKAYIDQYINAANTKDTNKLTELIKKSQKFIITRKIINEELSSNPKELNKFNDYIRKLDNMVAEVMTK
jgi:DNA repair ATPase RecN